MSTAAQIEANRANAAHSTGPRIPEGKQRSAANSTSHGLSGSSAGILANENLTELQQLRTEYLDEFLPSTAHELFLVEQMISARWRIARIQ